LWGKCNTLRIIFNAAKTSGAKGELRACLPVGRGVI